MGKTPGAMPPVREPRDQAKRQDRERSHDSLRIAAAPATLRLQVVQEELHTWTQQSTSARAIR
jgi:hypothetical protein